MLLFEYDSGHLYATRLGAASSQGVDPSVMAAVRDSVLEVVGRPLFPVQWAGSQGSHAAREEPHRLVAMDPSGQVVSVEVLGALDSVGLVAALARSGRTAAYGWLDLAEMYSQGPQAFRRDWGAFRESLPPRPIPGPRLYIVTGSVGDDVRPALEMLADSGVEVYEVTQRTTTEGRVLVEITEPFRVTVPTIGAISALYAGQRPDLIANSDADLQRILSAAPAEAEDASSPALVASHEPAAPDFRMPARHDAPAAPPTHLAPAPPAPAATPAVPYGATAPAAPPPPAPPAPVAAPTFTPVAPAAPQAPLPPSYAINTAPPPPSYAPELEPHPRLAQLAGEIGKPTTLAWVQLRRGIRLTANLRGDGLIELTDGRKFADPSEAASAASHRPGVDGWAVWHLGDEGPSLNEALEQLSRWMAARR